MRPILIVAASFGGLSLLWNLPVAVSGFGWPWVAAALEVTILFALLAIVPRLRSGRTAWFTALIVAIATTAVVVPKLAELAIQETLARPLNPLLDLYLVSPLIHLLTDTLGGPIGWTSVAAFAFAPFLVCAISFATVRVSQRALSERFARRSTLVVCLVLLALFAIQRSSETMGRHRVVSNHASVTLLRHWRSAVEERAGMKAFESAIARDPLGALPPSRLFAGLRGSDVLLMFVESYGRSAVELPRYAETVEPTLAAFEERLAERGLRAVSAWLTSPTVGGQSWLAQGTFVSGLWLADQVRHDVVMLSGRLTLTRAFTRAGYRTVAIKPAVTLPWPEGARLGFTRIYAAADLGYAGKPFNWVTMPDQYTLSFLEHQERTGAKRPLFAEVSLISSHAPWTPIAPVLDDWTSIGDGRVFSRWAEEGDPPEVVWLDSERVRVQYTRAIDYVLSVLASYAVNFVDEHTLLILVGDHQPAPLITGEGAGRDVPIHVISADAELLAPFENWGFTPGMRPPTALPARRMDAFRDFFIDAFSGPAE